MDRRIGSLVIPPMSRRDASFRTGLDRTGLDRMDHPLSHTAAVVAGVAFVVFAGCLALMTEDRDMLRSSNWWSVFVLASSVMTVSVMGYFRPRSRAIYVPVLLAGVVSLGVCVWHMWWVLRATSMIEYAEGLYRSLVLFGVWLAWAGRTFWHLRGSRRAG